MGEHLLPESETALIVGAGAGLSAALARLFVRESIQVALAARDTDKLVSLRDEIGAQTFKCDASESAQVSAMFEAVEAALGSPDIVVYNASGRARGPFIDLVPSDVERTGCRRLWRLSGRAAGRSTHADQGARRDPVHWGVGQPQGLSPVGGVRHGQVRASRPGTKPCA